MSDRKKLLFLLIPVLVIVTVSTVFFFVSFFSKSSSHRTAHIYLDGKLVESVDMETLKEPLEKVIRCGKGYNTVRIDHDSVCVIDADCSGKDCVRSGKITQAGRPIACLPHHLLVIIQEEADTGYDGITG